MVYFLLVLLSGARQPHCKIVCWNYLGFLQLLTREYLGIGILSARNLITRPFTLSEDEHKLYLAVTEYLQNEDSYAMPLRHKHLTALIIRKFLASSSSHFGLKNSSTCQHALAAKH